MKSSKEALRKRGYIEDLDIVEYYNLSEIDLINMLNSSYAYQRTIAIRILNKGGKIENEEFHNLLVHKLITEKSLYTKLEICEILKNGNCNTLIKMFKYLGKIGANQYVELPLRTSMKKSYPLPRDIIGRIIANMNILVIDTLLDEIRRCDLIEARELIDAIGFICFYNKVTNKERVVDVLINCYEKNKSDEIFRWKFVTALSAFNSENSILKLYEIKNSEKIQVIKDEVERSLMLVKR